MAVENTRKHASQPPRVPTFVGKAETCARLKRERGTKKVNPTDF